MDQEANGVNMKSDEGDSVENGANGLDGLSGAMPPESALDNAPAVDQGEKKKKKKKKDKAEKKDKKEKKEKRLKVAELYDEGARVRGAGPEGAGEEAEPEGSVVAGHVAASTPLEAGRDDEDLDSIIKQSHAKLAEISDSASQSQYGRGHPMNATGGLGHRNRPDTQMVRTVEDGRGVDYDRRRTNNSSLERDGGLVDPSRTADHFGKGKASAFAVMGNSALAGQDLAGQPK